MVATDGKPHSEKALQYAFVFAKAFKATLYILYVVNPKSGEDKSKIIKNGMIILGRAKIKAAEMGVEVNTLLEAGDPQETIAMTSERIKSEVIVVGNSGPKKGLMAKSVSEAVVRNVGCTVIVVK